MQNITVAMEKEGISFTDRSQINTHNLIRGPKVNSIHSSARS